MTKIDAKITQIHEKVKNVSRKKLIVFIALLAVTLLFAFTGWGILSTGRISITLFLVPIALGVILLGLWQGLLFALIFGLTSIWMANSLEPESIERVFCIPWVSLLPRLTATFLAWALVVFLKRSIDDTTRSAKIIIGGLTSIMLVIFHSALVMLILLKYAPNTFGIDGEVDTLLKQSSVIADVISNNLCYEMIITVLVVIVVTWLYHRSDKVDKSTISMNRTLRKWITLAVSAMALSILIGSYTINTIYEDESAKQTIEMALKDIADDYDEMIKKNTYREVLYKLGQHGHTLLVQDNTLIAADMTMSEDVSYQALRLGNIDYNDTFMAGLFEKSWLCRAILLPNGMTLIGMLPKYEIHVERNRTIIELLIGLLFLCTIIYIQINYIVQKNLTNNVYLVRKGLHEIRKGLLETRLSVYSNREFTQISDDINDTVQSLQDAQNEVKRRIQSDMELAHHIQMSTLPPGTKQLPEYQIAASMLPARDVGGDFYDYFELPNRRIGLVIADVSGKGIPAAMFMMRAKTVVKNDSLQCNSPAEVLERANQSLCENNEAEMFVTLWLGFVDLKTGRLTFANAGHNPPLWAHGDEIEYLDYKHYKRGMMLGAMDTIRYHDNIIQLSQGDQLVLYTDGITEANNPAMELFGEERLLNTIHESPSEDAQSILQLIHQAVDAFEHGTEQADDKTILVFNMSENIQSIQVLSDSSNAQKVNEFVEKALSAQSPKTIQKFLICTDEIFSNIVQYAKASQIEVFCRLSENQIALEFRDDGIAYNPLDTPEPDTTQSAEERGIGGYGIFIVKKLMHDVSYQYMDGYNRLTIIL